jgi:hypothetical protein
LLVNDDHDKADLSEYEDPKREAVAVRSIDLGHPEDVQGQTNQKESNRPHMSQVVPLGFSEFLLVFIFFEGRQKIKHIGYIVYLKQSSHQEERKAKIAKELKRTDCLPTVQIVVKTDLDCNASERSVAWTILHSQVK